MSKELLSKAQAVIRLANKHGAQGARATVHRNRESRVEWRDGKLDRIREHTRMGLGLTLYVDNRYSSHTTSDLRPEALERFVEQTVAMTRHLAVDKHRRLPDPKRYEGMFTGELKVYDAAGVAAGDPDKRRRVARELEEAARAAGDPKRIVSVTGICSESESEGAKATSNGMTGTSRSTGFARVALVSVRDRKGPRKPTGWWYDGQTKRAGLASPAAIGKEAYRRAFMQVGASPLPSGKYPCIIENATAGRLFSWLMRPLWGNPIQQQRSFMADQLGKAVAAPVLTLVDDPHLPGGFGSRRYDSEGMAARKRTIIEKGVLRSFYLDTYYASKLGRTPTSGSRTNLVFSQGSRDLAGLLGKMDKGILITGFSGGNSNSATGDFSIGIRGMWVEGGKPTRPVTEMNLAGNHLSFWKQLQELGNDPWEPSSTRIPSLRFGAVQFSGMDAKGKAKARRPSKG
jgi:PmbA protein